MDIIVNAVLSVLSKIALFVTIAVVLIFCVVQYHYRRRRLKPFVSEDKIDINREDLYSYKGDNERTRERLIQMNAIGMEEVGTANFGIEGICSGLYIENVWNYSDEDFNSYLQWVEQLKNEKQK